MFRRLRHAWDRWRLVRRRAWMTYEAERAERIALWHAAQGRHTASVKAAGTARSLRRALRAAGVGK